MKGKLFLISLILSVVALIDTKSQDLIWKTVERSNGIPLEEFQVLKKKKKTKHGNYKKYYKEGQINIEANYIEGVLQGEWKSFHYNGRIAVSGVYKANQKEGKWSYYDVDGILRVESYYEKDEKTGSWSFFGKAPYSVKVNYYHGSPHGSWGLYKNDEIIASCKFLDGELEPSSFSYKFHKVDLNLDSLFTVPQEPAIFYMLQYDGHERVFGPAPNEPMFAMGIDAFNRYLQDYVRLPKSVFPSPNSPLPAKRTCYIQVSINQVGMVEEVEIIRSFSKDLDKELTRVIKQMPIWMPAINEGLPVRSMITIPYTFQVARL